MTLTLHSSTLTPVLLSIGNGGWAEVEDLPLLGGRRLYVKFEPDSEGRMTVVDLYVDGGGRSLSAALLRRLPVELIEGHANSFLAVGAIQAGMASPASPMAVLASHYATTAVGDHDWVSRARLSQVPESSEPVVPVQPPRGAPFLADELPAQPPLFAPAGGALSIEFLQQVKAVYEWALTNGHAPAKVMAEQTDVSERTAQGWVAKARRRGVMLPGRQGKKGL